MVAYVGLDTYAYVSCNVYASPGANAVLSLNVIIMGNISLYPIPISPGTQWTMATETNPKHHSYS